MCTSFLGLQNERSSAFWQEASRSENKYVEQYGKTDSQQIGAKESRATPPHHRLAVYTDHGGERRTYNIIW